MTEWGLSQIGKATGGFHHTTVLAGLREVRRQRAQDQSLAALIAMIIQEVKTGEENKNLETAKRVSRMESLEHRIKILESIMETKVKVRA